MTGEVNNGDFEISVKLDMNGLNKSRTCCMRAGSY